MTELTPAERDMVAARVRTALARHEQRPGQLRADLLADAIVLDMQDAQVPTTALATIADDVLVQAARNLRKDFGRPIDPFALPFGSRVTAGPPGSVVIGGRILLTRAGVPGLQPVETASRHAHGATLEDLRNLIRLRSSVSLLDRLGLPTPSISGDCGVVRHHLDFPPLHEAGGAVLRHDVEDIGAARFRGAPTSQLEAFAGMIVGNAQRFWRRRQGIALRAQAVRRAAEARIPAGWPWGGRSLTVARICIDARSLERSGHPTLIVEYDGFDDALRRGRLIDVVRGDEDPASAGLLRAPRAHALRVREASRLRTSLANGSIDVRAAAVAQAAPEGARAVLLRLALDLETVVSIPKPRGPFHAVLFWRDGVIRAEAIEGCGPALWRDEVDAPTIGPGTMREFDPGSCWTECGWREPTWLVNTAAGTMWATGADQLGQQTGCGG